MFGNITKKDLELINNYFEEYIEFTQYKRNTFNYIENTGNKKLDILFNKWNEKIKETENIMKNDMGIVGEVVLTTEKVNQGVFKCRVKKNSLNPMVNTLKQSFNSMLDSMENNMLEIENTLVSFSNNDFRPNINIKPTIKGQMFIIMENVNNLSKTLNYGASNNLHNGEFLEYNSKIMEESSKEISRKAYEQASSLEETAAAIEEITSIARNNAENSIKMSKLGDTVKSSLHDGQILAQQTASSMEEINSEVAAINSAIEIVDKIAFQTNILSLNAAVEAATAGEAGRGFAVVAGEVRNLASRSAEAAKEIKKLVQVATTKANEGKKISNTMIKGYEELNLLISKTTNIIEDVSISAKEQMQGIEQINYSVSIIDKMMAGNIVETDNIKDIAEKIEKISSALLNDAKAKKFIKQRVENV